MSLYDSRRSSLTSAGGQSTYRPTSGIPFLPGNTFTNPAKKRFHKSHVLDKRGAVTVLEDTKPGIGGEPLPTQRPTSRARTSAHLYPQSRELGTSQPSWVAFDKQVLRFYAFFKEPVHEARWEAERVREVTIMFYLEDDTIMVTEAHTMNSGMNQGVLIRRHRIPRDMGNPDTDFFIVEDLNVGREVTFFGKTFHITRCDQFTRDFLNRLGIDVPAEDSTPVDPYATHRATQKRLSEKATHVVAKQPDTLRQFLENDRRVLRFFCYWDDSGALYGDERYMTLHYFLADDTVEVREMIGANAGRDPLPQFMKRGRLPKVYAGMDGIGERVGQGPYSLWTNSREGTVYYSDADLRIGATVNVYGRRFLIYDVDDFTKDYYREKYGVTDFTPYEMPSRRFPPLVMPVPPPTGFGSEEDSLGSVNCLMPKPPTKDLKKMIDKEGKVLRFTAQLVRPPRGDADRRFVVSFYLGDDTVSIHEPVVRNSGRVAGKFLERSKQRLANNSRYFVAQDFFVGTQVTVTGHTFLLTDADEYAFRYMEANEGEFPFANINVIVDKLRDVGAQAVGDAFKSVDKTNRGVVTPEQFQDAMDKTRVNLNGHELLTLMRRFDIDGDAKIHYEELVNAL